MSLRFAGGRLGRAASLVCAFVVCGAAGARAQTPVAGPWVSKDIGSPAIAGDATGTDTSFTITAGGEDIWGSSDQFHFVYQPISGDVDVRARVDSITAADSWSKAGVMIRGSLNASAPHAFALVSVAKGMAFQRRRSAGATSLHTAGPWASAPAWVRLVRAGTKVTTYSSPDGKTWTTIGSDTIQLGTTAYVGIAVTSHNASAATTAKVSQVSVAQSAGGSLPSGQSQGDIGSPALKGSATYSSGAYTITAAGADIWGTSDQFHFVYAPVSGDVDVRARVDSVTQADSWSKAGVMIRGSLNASSAHAFALVSAAKGMAFQRRLSSGAESLHTAGPYNSAPAWVRLVRAGTKVTAYVSADGSKWTTIGSDTIQLGTTAYVGIAVTSHNPGAATTAKVSQFSASSQAGGALPSGQAQADVGAPALTGTANYSSGTYTITAAGTDIWDTADQFHYVYEQASGDLDVSVRVASISATDRWSKAGVMVRETLNAGSKHALALVSVAKGYAFQRRATTNGLSDNTAGWSSGAPGWVRLKRSGDMFTAYESTDGQTWKVIGSDSIAMADNVYVGIAVTSHDATAYTKASADHFSVSSTPTTTNKPPTVAFTSPSDGATFTAPATISMAASASDPEGQLAKVEFYQGNTLLKSDTTSGYSYSWTSVPAGTYTLTAKAYDASGATATDTVTVTVGSATNKPPTVSLTSPSNGATYTAPANITLTANASDPENQLSKVEFYRGSTLLGTDTSAPYSFTWSSVPAGSYTFTAKAYDAKGATATSAAVSVTVNGTTTTPPTGVAFLKSPDHDTLVTSYRLEVFSATANVNTATPIATYNAGKPTPDSTGTITVTASSFFSGLSTGTYQLVVAAIGQGGAGLSAPVTFTR